MVDTSGFGRNLRSGYTAIRAVTSSQLRDALNRIGAEDGTADQVLPNVIAKLIEFKMVELSATGLPRLTEYGQECYVIFDSAATRKLASKLSDHVLAIKELIESASQ